MINLDRDSLRGVIDRNAIAPLSNYHGPTIDPTSPQWLGRFSNRDLVRNAGLWNQRHVDENHDPGFLDLLDELIDSCKDLPPLPPSSAR